MTLFLLESTASLATSIIEEVFRASLCYHLSPMRSMYVGALLLALIAVAAGTASNDRGSIIDEGLVIWRLQDWQKAARVTGQLSIVLPPNTGEVNLSACFTSVTRDSASTLTLSARVNRSCIDEEGAKLTVNTTLRGPEFYGGYTREAIIYPSHGASHFFSLSPSRIEGLGLEYDPTRFWAERDRRVAKQQGELSASRITPRWVGQPLVQRQATLPINVTFLCLLPPGSGSLWNFTNLDASAAHTLLIGTRLYTLGAGATVRALVNVQPPFALSTPLAQWVGDLRDAEGVALTRAPTTVVPPRYILSESILPSCYCGYNVACALTAESTRYRRVEHLSALDLGALVNGAVLLQTEVLPIAEAVAVFSDRDANIFRWVMIGFAVALLFWCLWTCLASPPSTLVPPTLDGLKFAAEVAQPYRTAGEVAQDAIPVSRSAAPNKD